MFSIIFCLTPCIKPFHLFNTLFGYNTLYLKKRKVCTLQLKLFGTSVLPELSTGSSSEQIGSTLAARAEDAFLLWSEQKNMAPAKKRNVCSKTTSANTAKKAKIDPSLQVQQIIDSRKNANNVFDVLELLQVRVFVCSVSIDYDSNH